MTVRRYADLARAVLDAAPRLGPVRLVAVDGPAGSGKTTFAGRLGRALRAAGATVAEVHTDDLLEGWADTVSFWPRLEQQVLGPLRRGESGAYRRYDWDQGKFRVELIPVPVTDVLIVEGVTTARTAIRGELTLAVWLAAPRELRLARGIERDGEALRPQWLRWMADEATHFAADRTEARADLRVDGAPGTPHDPETEYVAGNTTTGRGTNHDG